MNRPTIDEYFMNMALAVSARSTCVRRKVGAVAVDIHNYLLSTGYNGVPKEAQHCIDVPCGGEDFQSGKGLDECKALHAETNAIVHCMNPLAIHTIYVTVTPCLNCMKLLLATNCRRIVAYEIYDEDAAFFWRQNHGTLNTIERKDPTIIL